MGGCLHESISTGTTASPRCLHICPAAWPVFRVGALVSAAPAHAGHFSDCHRLLAHAPVTLAIVKMNMFLHDYTDSFFPQVIRSGSPFCSRRHRAQAIQLCGRESHLEAVPLVRRVLQNRLLGPPRGTAFEDEGHVRGTRRNRSETGRCCPNGWVSPGEGAACPGSDRGSCSGRSVLQPGIQRRQWPNLDPGMRADVLFCL